MATASNITGDVRPAFADLGHIAQSSGKVGINGPLAVFSTGESA